MSSKVLFAAVTLSAAVLCGGGRALACTNDNDCACGQVCSWPSGHVCVTAGTDPGWCGTSSECIYQGQTCSGTACTPAWTSSSVCILGTATTTTSSSTTSGAATSTHSAGSTSSTSGTSGASATTGAAGSTTGGSSGVIGTSCVNDVDCGCGYLCSWKGATPAKKCIAAVVAAADPGWCGTGSQACEYQGQTCQGTACSPGWTAASVCVSGGDGGTPPASSGGCSTAPGALTLAAAALGLGLLRRRRPV